MQKMSSARPQGVRTGKRLILVPMRSVNSLSFSAFKHVPDAQLGGDNVLSGGVVLG